MESQQSSDEADKMNAARVFAQEFEAPNILKIILDGGKTYYIPEAIIRSASDCLYSILDGGDDDDGSKEAGEPSLELRECDKSATHIDAESDLTSYLESGSGFWRHAQPKDVAGIADIDNWDALHDTHALADSDALDEDRSDLNDIGMDTFEPSVLYWRDIDEDVFEAFLYWLCHHELAPARGVEDDSFQIHLIKMWGFANLYDIAPLKFQVMSKFISSLGVCFLQPHVTGVALAVDDGKKTFLHEVVFVHSEVLYKHGAPIHHSLEQVFRTNPVHKEKTGRLRKTRKESSWRSASERPRNVPKSISGKKGRR